MNKIWAVLLAFCVPVLLTGCNAYQSASTLPTSNMSGALPNAPSQQRSWMLANAKTDKLLYASDEAGSEVYVFSYATHRRVGLLAGFSYPSGECVDARGNVWITEQDPGQIVEFAHGGTSPIATLSVPGFFATACSIDPTTGNLAVLNRSGVDVYQNATGTPKQYAGTQNAIFNYCAYDESGNLFVSGQVASSFFLAELKKHAGSLTAIKVQSDAPSLNSIQWYGKYLTVIMAQSYGQKLTYVARLHIANDKAEIIRTTKLVNQREPFNGQFLIEGGHIIGPSAGFHGNAQVLDQWNYPIGGRIKGKFVSGGTYYVALAGVAVSAAR
ncbi:MAG TPA: hypothetical protein VGK84_01335 [Candidatus Tumulicola sp.]